MDAAPSDRTVDFAIDRLDEFLRGQFGGGEPTQVERTQGACPTRHIFSRAAIGAQCCASNRTLC